METFSFIPPISLSEKGKWLSAVTSFEATKSLFCITNEIKNFSNTEPGFWCSRGGPETLFKQREFLELREQSDVELDVEEIRKQGDEIKKRENEFKLSDLGSRKNEIIEQLKKVEYNGLEDMVFKLKLTYSEILKILDMKHFISLTTGYILEPGIFEISDISLMFYCLLPDDVIVNLTIDDIKLTPK